MYFCYRAIANGFRWLFLALIVSPLVSAWSITIVPADTQVSSNQPITVIWRIPDNETPRPNGSYYLRAAEQSTTNPSRFTVANFTIPVGASSGNVSEVRISRTGEFRLEALKSGLELPDVEAYTDEFIVVDSSGTSPTSSSSASSPTSSDGATVPNTSSTGPPIGAIVGGVVGGLAVIIALILLFFWRRRKQARTPKSSPSWLQGNPIDSTTPTPFVIPASRNSATNQNPHILLNTSPLTSEAPGTETSSHFQPLEKPILIPYNPTVDNRSQSTFRVEPDTPSSPVPAPAVPRRDEGQSRPSRDPETQSQANEPPPSYTG